MPAVFGGHAERIVVEISLHGAGREFIRQARILRDQVDELTIVGKPRTIDGNTVHVAVALAHVESRRTIGVGESTANLPTGTDVIVSTYLNSGVLGIDGLRTVFLFRAVNTSPGTDRTIGIAKFAHALQKRVVFMTPLDSRQGSDGAVTVELLVYFLVDFALVTVLVDGLRDGPVDVAFGDGVRLAKE